MCNTRSAHDLSLLPPIVNDGPGDDSTYLDRPSAAPNADRIEALEGGLSDLRERGTNLLRSIDYTDERVDDLFSRVEQITDRLVKLAVAQAHLRAHLESPKRGLLDRIRVRLGRPIF